MPSNPVDLIERLSRTSTANELAHEMRCILARFGFDYFCFTSIPGSGQRFEHAMLAIHVPPEWMRLYLEEDYVQVDPTIRHCGRTASPFEWSSAPYDPEEEPRAAEMVRRATDFGLSNGWWVPIYDGSRCKGGVWMGGRRLDVAAGTMPLLHVVSLYAFHRMRRLPSACPVHRIDLTEREREVLTWSARGKSAWEIGEILGISKRTVDVHARTACGKLGAVSRIQAVALALLTNAIAP